MAITAAQRKNAVDALLQNYREPARLAVLVPGLTPAAMLTAITNAIGANVDATLTTCLATLVTEAQTGLTAANATVTNLNAIITADTVV